MNVLKTKFDTFVKLADKNVGSKPWLVVILMHEYFRNLYPSDPHMPFDKDTPHVERISSTLDTCVEILQRFSPVGSYYDQSSDRMESVVKALVDKKRAVEGKTQRVYGMLWDKFEPEIYTKEAHEILMDRFRKSVFDFSELKNKVVLDMGCGSGRYSIALSMTGAQKVYGIDLGKKSIERAAEIAKRAGVKNVEFQVGDVLNLPFKKDFFDFVFCNGVLHHTENMERGIQEVYRVLKPEGTAFLYLYADGGIFWYSREKMRQVMQKIPQEYTMAVLDLIGMPQNRFIFTDNWYVPIERHTTRKYLEDYLKKVGFSSVIKHISSRATDLDSASIMKDPDAKTLWGDGEHRYFLTK
jgi:ubiquinone/menaquinone biosynthesis C-methylase UbiE